MDFSFTIPYDELGGMLRLITMSTWRRTAADGEYAYTAPVQRR